VGGCCSRYGDGAVLVGDCAGVHVGGSLLGTISPCAGRHFVAVSWRAVGAFQAWAVLLALSRVPCRSFLLNTKATVRGGTSFLFPTAKKKRSKENAYKRQPVASALAQPRPWSESRTVPAVQHAIENPSCFTRQCTLRPHGRIYSAASASVLVSTSVLASASVLGSALISVPILVSALVLVSAWISISVRVVLDLGFDLDLRVAAPARPGFFSDHIHCQRAFAVVLACLFTVA
jgi:hypothetical protein